MTQASLVRLCVAALVYALTLLDAAAAEHKRVMILHSFGREFRPWNEYARAIRGELDRQSPWVLDVQEHALMAARTPDSNPEPAFVEYLHALYAGKPPELIICIGAPAAIFIQRYRQKLFPSAPMLFTAVEQRRIQFANLTENDTVVAVRHDFRYLFESFLAIAPETRVIAMVNGNSPNELVWQDEMRRELQPLEQRVDVRWYDKRSFEDMLKEIAVLPPHSAIFWFQMIIDGAGVAHEGDRALTRLYAVANAPIFTTDQAFFGREIIGGPMHSPTEGGRRTAAVAMRILGGEKPADIKTPPSDFQPPKYDARELKRWNVSESRLPAGSEVDFREPSIWQTYRWQIALILAVLVAQALLITLLVHERGRRLIAEVQSRQRMSELAHVNRFTTANELTASIAHEINQPLGAIRTNAETMALMIKSSSPDMSEIREIVADIRRDEERASEVILRLRSLLKKTPFELREVDLNGVVGETLEFLAALTVGRQVSVDRALEPGSLIVKGDRIQLQQVILNLVVNAIDAMSGMAAANRRIAVRTDRNGNFAEVSIADSGSGIPQDKLSQVFQPFFTTKEHGMGMGLSIARTIVEAHAGQLLAENDAQGGARFRIRLPLA
ncbi:ATPase [Bradyrhizobium guangdongense]|uniref:sensor histidine kinase n=1 Tax=Bradyrhizobium guangdongense TaxID=1325090 RepID=UPI00112A552A|nr:ATP-binding protein [Bradyrhizobium guangdongense]TPQ30310.1 ATPase [Bradyrhizobium guangdongense]